MSHMNFLRGIWRKVRNPSSPATGNLTDNRPGDAKANSNAPGATLDSTSSEAPLSTPVNSSIGERERPETPPNTAVLEDTPLDPSPPTSAPPTYSETFPEVFAILKQVRAERRRARATSRSFWREYQLTERDWPVLKRFMDGMYDPRPDYHYFSRTQTFVHCWALGPHSSAQFRFFFSLSQKWIALSSGDDGGRMLFVPPTDVEAMSGFDCHIPNGVLAYAWLPRLRGVQHSVIVEIGYSQKRTRFEELAQFYLLKTTRTTRLVIFLDFGYPGTNRVTLLTWRRDHSDPVAENKLICYAQEMRSADGTLIPGPPLQITMLDLMPADHVPFSLRNKAIEYSVEELCGLVPIVPIDYTPSAIVLTSSNGYRAEYERI
ncbi:uncharacterized protein Z519_00126 [Cladophialophora bantiana CBS 173.52]|uniref:Uncharacterized protein n=1 Tax=Cladophialophora bantiana (strain ATCC 10958 / CBS 173.52 / CDC B-1940 / NIH 8579) TaxID=1442370 RepID=A0A0D2I5D1_CLAB1|nr:uncharacterized protein Z519_00126 [Cladophialophora bantiana CBS 173.52]KIW98465.1 hypothetical protein Z519_00126 [Cladophialophora bantiana CBS 173.52]